jgi:hypothetical protein
MVSSISQFKQHLSEMYQCDIDAKARVISELKEKSKMKEKAGFIASYLAKYEEEIPEILKNVRDLPFLSKDFKEECVKIPSFDDTSIGEDLVDFISWEQQGIQNLSAKYAEAFVNFSIVACHAISSLSELREDLSQIGKIISGEIGMERSEELLERIRLNLRFASQIKNEGWKMQKLFEEIQCKMLDSQQHALVGSSFGGSLYFPPLFQDKGFLLMTSDQQWNRKKREINQVYASFFNLVEDIIEVNNICIRIAAGIKTHFDLADFLKTEVEMLSTFIPK